MQVIYKSAETRGKQNEIQSAIRQGLVLVIENGNTHEKSYMLNEHIAKKLLTVIPMENHWEYDKDMMIYTCSNSSIPALFGEGKTKQDAMAAMVHEAIELAEDYVRDPSIFSGVLDEVQQFVMANLVLAGDNKEQVKEILKVG